MTIGFFIRNLAGGGAERVAVNLANEMANDHTVYFFLIEKSGPYVELINASVNLIELKNKRLITSVFNLSTSLKKYKVDVLISNLTHENMVAATASLFQRNRLIAVEHNNLDREMADRGIVTHQITKTLYRLLGKRVNCFVAVSEGVKGDITSLFPKNKVVTIHNPIIEHGIIKAVQEIQENSQHDTPRSGLLFVGRLTEQKNPELAIRVFKHLLDVHHYNGSLTILGDGHLRMQLKKLTKELGIANQVHFMGFQDNPYYYMSKAELLILTSYWEGFGNVLVEGMYCGAKVVSYDCDYGPREIINSDEIGSLVKSMNPSEFAAVVFNELNSNKDDGLRRSRAREFSVQVAVDKYKKLINV